MHKDDLVSFCCSVSGVKDTEPHTGGSKVVLSNEGCMILHIIILIITVPAPHQGKAQSLQGFPCLGLHVMDSVVHT